MRPCDNTWRLFVAQVAFKSFQTHPSGADLQKATNNNSDHAGQKSVGADLKAKAFTAFVYPQMGGTDPADRMFIFCWRLAKSVIIFVLRQQIYRCFHTLQIQLHIRIQGTACLQKRILSQVYEIIIAALDRIKTSICPIMDRNDVKNGDIRRKGMVEIEQQFVQSPFYHICMKKILAGVYARVRTPAAID